MSRRRTKRYTLPKINIPGLKLPKVNLPKVHLPQIKLPVVNIPIRQMLGLAVVAVLVLVMINLNTRLSDYYRLSGDRDTLKGQVDRLLATKQVLETQVAYAQSDKAVEEYARNSHMVRDGEKLVVVLTPQDNPITTPEITVATPKPFQNWEIWWELLFGGKTETGFIH